MQLHHDKHHKTYVDAANATLDKLEVARSGGDFGAIVGLQKTLSFNLSGHINHTIFWQNMGPDGHGQPAGEFSAAITEFFGGFEPFQAHFTQAATTIQGSGWAGLFYDQLSGGLLIEQLYDHQSNQATGTTPLLLLDMWEHAFYLDYLNVKADYVKAFWSIINWQDVSARLTAAKA